MTTTKRPFSSKVGIAGLWLVMAVSVGVSAEDWPRWRGPRGDGTWFGPAVPLDWKTDSREPVWEQKVHAGYSGISVADGRVYTMDRVTEPEESERVICFDARDGAELWVDRYPVTYGKLDYGKGPRATVTIDRGRAYALGAVGHLRCLDAKTGALLWSKDLKAEYQAQQPTWGFAAAPLIHQDLVIVHAGAKPNGCYLAFDRVSGKEKWRGGSDPTGYGAPIVVKHSGITQLIGWTPEHIVGLNIASGEVLWKQPYKVTYGVSIATPIFHQQTVVVCGYWEGSKAIRLGADPRQSALLWEENRYLRGIMSQPLYRRGHGYLLDKGHGLVCFELATGKMKWTDKHQLTPRNRNPQANLIWLGDSDRALALNAEGTLVQMRLSPEGFQELGRLQIIGETWAHPAFAGSHIYARDDERLVCVRITD